MPNNEALKGVGLAKTGIGAGLKLSQLTDLIGKGADYGGGVAAGGGTVPYAGMAAAAAWVAKNLITGNDYVDQNHSAREAMRATAAGAALVGGPWGWAAGAALALGSMLVPEDNPDPNQLFLSGSEKMNWGDEGLGGYEGIVWPEWARHMQAANPDLYRKSEEYLRHRIGSEAMQPGRMPDDPIPKTYKQKLAEYEAYQRGERPNWQNENDRDMGYYDWGITTGTSAEGPSGTSLGEINPNHGWVDTEFKDSLRSIPGRSEAIKSAKYGDVYSPPDIITQGAPWLGIQDLYGGKFGEEYYPQFQKSINQLTQGHLDVFNENIMAHLDTLPEVERAQMLEKLQNADFTINYSDPSGNGKNILSEGFTKDNPDAFPNFMGNVSKIVSKQLIDQAVKAGIPASAFQGGSSTDPAKQTTPSASEGSTMADQTSGREGQYIDYAKQQQGWASGWDKYTPTLEAYLKGDIADVQNPGEGYTAIPKGQWENIAGFAKGIDPMSSDTWQGGGTTPAPYNSQEVTDYIDGYDWNDYWGRLEDRATGLGDLYGSTAGRLEDVLGARQDMYQVDKGRSDLLYGNTLDDYNRQKERDAEIQATPGIQVTGPGGASFNMSQREGSKQRSTENLIRQGALRDSILNSIGSREGSFLSGWKGDLGDITNMYQSQLNAPVTSYQEMAPHVTRWEGYGQEGIKRDWLAQQAELDRQNRMSLGKMAQEGQDSSWADIMAAVGAGGGTLAQILGISTGKDAEGNPTNVLGSAIKGGSGIASAIKGLFDGGGFDDYSWASDMSDYEIGDLLGDVGGLDYGLEGMDWDLLNSM